MFHRTVEQPQALPILTDESTFTGKIHVIVGGNSGLGLETARHPVRCVVDN